MGEVKVEGWQLSTVAQLRDEKLPIARHKIKNISGCCICIMKMRGVGRELMEDEKDKEFVVKNWCKDLNFL